MRIKTKKSLIVTCLLLLFTPFIIAGCSSSDDGTISNSNDDIKDISKKDAQTELNSYIKKINASKAKPIRDIDTGSISEKEELPNIEENYPLSVEGKNQINAEIFVSPEKASDGTDGLFNDLATEFNNQNHKIDGKTISVSIRSVPSGTATDYIRTENHIPDGFNPSNQLWGQMIETKGPGLTQITDRTIGNTGGLLMKEDTYNKLTDKYKDINIDTLTKAVNEDNMLLGYTNPYTSSTGLSLLTQLMLQFDPTNPVSDQAVDQLKTFQKNLPSTLINTLQLREVAKNNSVDLLSISYQTYINSPELKSYKYIPMGIRQDSPMYVTNTAALDKQEVIKQFTTYIQEEKQQEKATKLGFNELNDYSYTFEKLDGNTITSIQHLWKENKSGGKPIIAVFVADVSGSMEGSPINTLRTSLLNSTQYINNDAYIGLVSYNDNVTIDLPIAQMDSQQRSYFTGAVKNLNASGGTATFSATLVALDMIQKQLEKTPDARPVIFVLSDGQTNKGYDFKNIAPIVKSLGISINTIGYNADLEELKKLSKINESATINADDGNVVYELKQLFNAEL